MISGIDLNETVDYSCKDDKKDPTIWKLGLLPSFVLARIMTRAKQEQTEALYEMVSIGLKGWSNFKSKGKDVEYRTEKQNLYGQPIDALPKELINMIPFPVVVELSTELMQVNQLTDEERKN